MFVCIYIYIPLWSLHHFSEEFLVFFTHTCSLEKFNANMKRFDTMLFKELEYCSYCS